MLFNYFENVANQALFPVLTVVKLTLLLYCHRQSRFGDVFIIQCFIQGIALLPTVTVLHSKDKFLFSTTISLGLCAHPKGLECVAWTNRP